MLADGSISPYYDEDGITIYHGQCEDVIPLLRQIGIVITSPPYNLGMHPRGGRDGLGNYEGWKAGSTSLDSKTKTFSKPTQFTEGYDEFVDAMPHEEYDAWQSRIVHGLWDALADDGAIFYNHRPRSMNWTLKLPLTYGQNLPLRQIIIWDRGTGMNFTSAYFLPKSEWIIVWAKDKWRLRSKTAGSVGDVWRFPPEQNNDHPTAFPLGLPARILEATTPRSVLDPFMGSGTTLRAAKDANIPAIGIDVSERYCEIAAKRLAQGVLGLV